jgi:hypothetical protein
MMDRQLAKQFRDRWQAVAAVELEEQRAASVGLRWKQLNAIWQLALGMGLRPELYKVIEPLAALKTARRSAGWWK